MLIVSCLFLESQYESSGVDLVYCKDSSIGRTTAAVIRIPSVDGDAVKHQMNMIFAVMQKGRKYERRIDNV